MSNSICLSYRTLGASVALVFSCLCGSISAITYTATPVVAGAAHDEFPLDGIFDGLNEEIEPSIRVIIATDSWHTRGLMEFDLQAIPNNSLIQSATLGLSTAGGSGTPADVSLLGYNADGILTTDDATAAATPIDTFTVYGACCTQANLDVTQYLKSLLGSTTHIGFRGQLVDETPPSDVYTAIGLRPGKVIVGHAEPVLTVEYISGSPLINGDFETGSHAGWVTTGVANVNNAANYLSLPGATGELPAENGTWFTTFGSGNMPNGDTIAQEFETIVGGRYRVSLESGGYGPLGTPQQLTVELEDVASNSELAIAMFSDPSASRNLGDIFEYGEFEFVATGATTRIKFTDSSVFTFNVDLFLDNVLVTLISAPSADYNNNGIVDAADYVVWRKTLGTTGLAPYELGDGNGDGNVTTEDYDVWRSQFGMIVGSGSVYSPESIPEPSGLLLLLLLLLSGFVSRRVW